MKRYLIGIVVTSFFLVGCLTEEDYEVEKLEIQDKSDLYGVWHFSNQSCLSLSCEPDFFLVLSRDSSYYVDARGVRGRAHAILTVFPMQWSISEYEVLEILPNWRLEMLHGMHGIPEPDPVYSNAMSNFDSSIAYTFSNFDSIVRAREIRDSVLHGSSKIDNRYKIIQLNGEGESQTIHLIENDCYVENPRLTSYSNVCGVDVLEKQNDFDVSGMLSQLDTLSSTIVWLNNVGPYRVKRDFWPKDSTGADIEFPQDSATGLYVDFE